MNLAPNKVSGRVVKISSSLSPVRRRGRIEREADQQAFRAADPIFLHQPDFFRPAVKPIERVEQVLRIFGDLEHPLAHLALLDDGAGAPAEAVDHLLIRQHGLIDRVPVHFSLLALDQAGAQKVEKHFLLVLVIGGIAGRDFAAPIQRQPDGFELLLHRRDVVVGPRLGMDLALHSGVLRRHAESVPAHRMQHIEPHRALVAGDHVAHGVIAHVAHMDAPRRIGEHFQHIVFRPWVFVLGGKDAALIPDPLPARLGVAGVVAVGSHWIRGRFRHDLSTIPVSRHGFRARCRAAKAAGRDTKAAVGQRVEASAAVA